MPADLRPSSLTLRVYKVGFGDCILLSFRYAAGDRHVLIDFGSSGAEESMSALLVRVAEDIREQCGGKLHAVVATHRHKDHISGFATRKNRRGPGDVIASLKPDAVIQPWTEDPDAQPDATRPTAVSQAGKAFVASLHNMHAVAEAVLLEIRRRRSSFGPTLLRQLAFLGEENIANRSAVENLQSMGQNRFYVHFDSPSGLEEVLPGVRVKVLGPPTLEQSSTIREQRARDEEEFWHLQALARESIGGGADPLFPGASTYTGAALPPHTRWFVRRMEAIRGDQMLEIVRTLDRAMNNTSVILLFQAGRKKLLFSGDAQIENWSYALSKASVRNLLRGVDLYKVGHHGSLNATPKSLWDLFDKRSKEVSPDRLQTILSTMPGKHGDARRGTEVPRRKLVEELKAKSNLFSTQEIRGRTRIRRDFEIEL